MFKKKMAMGGLAVLAMTVVVGTGFAVWNFETSDDASKGIYNLGLYVTPKVDTVGTVSTNNDYALILDQGDIPTLGEGQTLATHPDYYKRGIYVGELEKEGDGFKTLPNGSYSYKQVSELSGFWIQTVDDAKAIVAESVNDMTFTTTIKLRKAALARYVQVNLDDGIYYIDNETSKNVEYDYIDYVYNWGNLSEVLTNDRGILKYNKREFYDTYHEKDEEWFAEKDWSSREEQIDPLTDLAGGLPQGVAESDIYNVVASRDIKTDGKTPVGGNLTLRSHYAVVTYILFDTKNNVPLQVFGDNDSAQQAKEQPFNRGGELGMVPVQDLAVSVAYFMYYKTGLADTDLKNIESFANEQSTSEDESAIKYTEVTKTENDNIELANINFEIKECYYFKYTLNVINFGSEGVKDAREETDKRYYENARFSYYPSTQGESDGPAESASINDTLSELLTDSYSRKYAAIYEEKVKANYDSFISKAYYKKPAKVEEYNNMLALFQLMSGNDYSTDSAQFVKLGDRYVVVEFSSELITKASSGSGDPSLPGPGM